MGVEETQTRVEEIYPVWQVPGAIEPRGQSRTAYPGRVEPPPAADALQRPLRSRFQARLRRSVDMPADVKRREHLF